ncbi:MAG: hypothetical protein KGJ13_12970 [Patescibacteria group bacterium]|nr:hypothetical protein [Patescibacteria group bacterium]
MSNLPPPGIYPAKTNGQILVQKSQSSDAHYWRVPLTLDTPDGPVNLICNINFLGKDGETIQTKSIDRMRLCFPDWTSVDVFEVESLDTSAVELDADCDHEEYEGKMKLVVKWLNPRGGGMPQADPMEAGARKNLLNRLTSKLKAIGSGTGKKPAQAVSKPAADDSNPELNPEPEMASDSPPPRNVAKPASRKTAGGVKRTATREEVWVAWKKKNPGKKDADIAAPYYDAADAIDADHDKLTPAQWGEVADKLGV